jgi:hypothetical protein
LYRAPRVPRTPQAARTAYVPLAGMTRTPARYVPGVTFGDLGDPGSEPAWLRLYSRLRAAIEDGTYQPLTPMPTARQIHEESGLGRQTIARAYDKLRADGLVIQDPGRGPFVAPRD